MRKRRLIILGLVALIPIAALLVLIYTPLGVSLAATQLYRLERLGIRIEGVSGTFAGPLVVGRFELDHPRVSVVAHDIQIDLQVRGLLMRTLRARSVTAHDIQVQVREADMPPSDRPPRFLPSFLRIDARGAQLDKVRYVHIDGRTIEAERITGRVTISPRRLRVREFQVDAERFDAKGSLQLIAARPLGLELETDGTIELQPELTVRLGASLAGTIEDLAIRGEIREPSLIRVDGSFLREEDDWRIVGKVDSPSFTLDPWLDDPPLSFTNIALDAEVTREQIRTAGRFTIPEFELENVGVDARGRFAERALYVQSSNFTLPQSPAKLQASGTLAFQGGSPEMTLDAQWVDLHWPLRGDAVVHSRAGEASLRGRLPYEFTLRADVDGPNVPAATGTASGVLAKDSLTVARYDVNVLEGHASGQATLQFALPRAWTLQTRAEQLNSTLLHARTPGRVSFTAAASGRGLDKRADFDIALANVRGTINGERLRGLGNVERRGRRWRIEDLHLELGGTALDLNARIADTVDARWSFKSPALDVLLPQAKGKLELAGTARGPRDTPRITGRLRGSDLRYGEWSSATLDIEGDIDVSNAQPSTLTIAARKAGFGTRLVETIDARGEGTALDHRIAMEVVGTSDDPAAAPRALMQVLGKYENEEWSATVATTQFSRGDPTHALEIAEPANLLLSRKRAQLENFCLIVANGRLCAGGKWQRNGPWEGTISGYEIPLAMVLPRPEPDVEYAGRIEGSARAFGGPTTPWQGEAGMKISDVAIIYRPEGAEPETLNLGTGGMHIVAIPERIDFSFGVQAFTDTFLHTNAHLIRNGSNDLFSLPLTADVRARAADANLLPLVFPEVDRAAGVLTGTARITGTLARPEFDGRIELANGELDFYRVNLALRNLDLNARLADNRIDFRGTGNAGEGRLSAEGSLAWRDGQSSGQMRLRGEELLIADLPEYRVVASPDLNFTIEENRIQVKGEVTIPSARVQPARITGAVRASDDARYVGEHAAETEGRFTVHSDVRVRMGEDVRVDAFGLRARIDGAVTTSVHTGQTTTGHGELRVAEGRYEAYGQQLDITRGQLLFDNAPLDDPGLDIEARRRVETVTVGLNVRGTLQQPRLTFFSDPSMPQTQIVSYLLVGKPSSSTLSTASTENGSTSNALAMQGGGFLASQIGRRIGLEEVGVENYVNSAGEANPSLVLGKFLSPRLFISYGISLTESINTLKLRYTISDRWIFRTESGEAQSVDLEYTIER